MENNISCIKKKCEWCNEKESEYYCETCKLYLCEDCFLNHDKNDYEGENYN